MKKTSPETHRAASLVTLSALLLLLTVPIPVKADQYGDFTYSTDGTNATITGYTGSGGAVVIPSTINFLPVTLVGGYAFYNSFPGPTSITIPNSVTSIGESAFSRCSVLTHVMISSSVTNIGILAFANCPSLTTFVVDSNNPAFSSIDGVLFDKSANTLIQCGGGRTGSYAIPNSVGNITDSAFDLCAKLSSVTIPDSVTNIGGFAFWKCTNLTDVVVPDSIISVGIDAFAGCIGLTSAEIDGGVIGDSMFFGCTNLTNATIGNSVTSIGDETFYECTSLTDIVIPNSVTNIGGSAFGACYGLTSVVIDCGVTGDSMFSYCTNLTSVTVGNSVTSIGDWAFLSCESLTSITIPNSVKSIGLEAFDGCNLTSVTIPSSVTNIGSGPFADCTSLTTITVDAQNLFYSSVDGLLFDKSQKNLLEYPGGLIGGYTIPDGVTNIAAEAFSSCPNLTSVTIPSSVISIGNSAFYGCFGLTNVTIGGNVTSIGDEAFYECTSLTNIVIPSSVTSIGDEALADCISLTSVTIPASVISIGNSAFYGCIGLTNVTIGTNLTSIGSETFAYCSSLTSFTIPSSVTNIGAYAFMGCIGLTNVYFLGNAPNIDFAAFQLMMRTYSLDPATVYYLPGTSGWVPQVDTSGASFGVQSNQFGFTITGNSSLGVVVEACTNLAHPIWAPVAINIPAGSYFSDPLWTNYSPRFRALRYTACFYRLRASTFAGLPMVLWNPQVQTSDGSFGVGTNGFGFNIVGTTDIPIVLEASANLTGAPWTVLQSCNLTNGSVYFGDPAWTNYPSRFYRIRSP